MMISIVTLLIDRGGNGHFDVKKEALLNCSIQIISIVPNFLLYIYPKNFAQKGKSSIFSMQLPSSSFS